MISVIVTTYNRKDYLKETIDSILAQTYQDFELIVVDNYSDYDFMGLIASFNSKKIRPYQNNNHGIVAVNRNFGIKRAKGEFLAFCDDDDIWYPNKLMLQMKYIESHNADLIGTARLLFGDSVEKEKVFFHRYYDAGGVYRRNYLTLSTVLVKKTELVYFDENTDFNCSEDWALWMKLATLNYKIGLMPEPLVRYRISSSNFSKKNKVQPDFKAIRILKDLKKKYPNELKNKYYYPALAYNAIKGVIREIYNLINKK